MTPAIERRLTFEDPILDPIAEAVPLPPIASTGNVFHDLASCLLEQQIHYRSTKGVFRRMLERAGLIELTIDDAACFAAEALAGSSLSARKRDAFAHAVDFFESDTTDWHTLTDPEVRQRLSGIKGVGPWTVDMILLYTLERPDIFPAGDYHLKQAMGRLYDVGSGAAMTRRMQAIAEAWRPHRSLAVRYLLAWKDWQKEVLR